MAIKNKFIFNPKTKQEIRFIQTSRETEGRLLEMETIYNMRSPEPPPHYHPRQYEDFKVVEGELSVRIDGQLKVLRSGETLHIPSNKVHSMWNNTDGRTVVNWKIQPALNTEYLLETAMGLAMEGKVNKRGMPGLLQVVLIANKFAGVFRLSKPPYAVQRFLFAALTPFALLFGFRPTYARFID
jgi:quercetin dioxygenase-like cupin family protein